MARSSQTQTCWLFQVRNNIQEGVSDVSWAEVLQHRICAEWALPSAPCWKTKILDEED